MKIRTSSNCFVKLGTRLNIMYAPKRSNIEKREFDKTIQVAASHYRLLEDVASRQGATANDRGNA